jgi:hypothetical protein
LQKGHVIHNPSFLHYQIEKQRKEGHGPFVKGEIYWGHTAEKLSTRVAAQRLAEKSRVDRNIAEE